MTQNDFLMFPTYNAIIGKYKITSPSKLSRISIYTDLFDFYYSDMLDAGDAMDGVSPALSADTLSHWVNGKNWINDAILDEIMSDPRHYFNVFKLIWEKAFYDKIINVPDGFNGEMLSALDKDPFGRILKEEGTVGRRPALPEEILSEALIQSLANEYIAKNVGIDDDFLNKLIETFDSCKAVGNDMRMPYILNIILNKPGSRLLRALNSLSPSLGERVRNGASEYANKARHSTPFSDIPASRHSHPVMDCRFIFLAQKNAYMDGRNIAREQDIVYGMLAEDAGTLAPILAETGGSVPLMNAVLATSDRAPTSFTM